AFGPDQNRTAPHHKVRFLRYCGRVLLTLSLSQNDPLQTNALSGCRNAFVPLAGYSITSSARTRKVSGIVRPITLAVVRLTISSKLVGCSTGMSAGCVPRRILSTNSAARLYMCGAFGP